MPAQLGWQGIAAVAIFTSAILMIALDAINLTLGEVVRPADQ